MNKLLVLITGATGQQGGALARLLLERGHTVRALTRKPESEKAKQLLKLGAKLIEGDFDNPNSLKKAASYVDAVFEMATPHEAGPEAETRQGIIIADIAEKTGVKHLVYSSISDADRNTRIPHFESKFRMENWFNRVEYSADIEGLRRDYPTVGWTGFRDWAKAQDWSVLN